MDIKTTADLQAAISLLEVDVSVKKKILMEQFHTTRENLRPTNIIKKAFARIREGFNDMIESGDLVEKLIGTSVGFGAGVLSKKILVGKPTNIFKRILGTSIELAVAGVVSKNSEVIKEKGLHLWKKLSSKHEGQKQNYIS